MISSQLGFSDSTIKRYRNGINMDSLYNRKKHKKKIKSSTTITATQTHTLGEELKKTENNKTNDLKGGFGLENNHQEDNTKFIYIKS